MVIHRALDEVFRSWSHVAVLRALVDTATGFSGNEVARVAGMTPVTALKALTSLEELRIVNRQRGGREHLFTLNREHYFVQGVILKLYQSERQFPDVVSAMLAGILNTHVVSAVIFGSVSRREETPQSDLDLCCLVRAEQEKETVLGLLNEKSSELHRRFGVKVAPVLFTVQEFKKKGKSRNRLVASILADNKLVVGRDLKRLMYG
jgi:predicted nucleotidyltransferase